MMAVTESILLLMEVLPVEEFIRIWAAARLNVELWSTTARLVGLIARFETTLLAKVGTIFTVPLNK